MIPKVASWKEGRVAELKEIISSDEENSTYIPNTI